MTECDSVQPWPANGLEYVVRCPLCNSTDRRLLHAALQDWVFFTAPGVWDLYQCKICGTGWLDPRPNEATIGLAYGQYFTHHLATSSPPTSVLGKFRASLGNGYRNSRYGTRLAPSLLLGRFAAAFLPAVKWQIDVSYRYLPNPSGRKLRLLDVGCGNGGFLQTAREAGWNTFGVEPDPLARHHAENAGHEVRPDVAAWSESDEPFDAITMSHVIEHVHNPRELLTRVFALMRPGGHLFVDTPNIDAIGHKIYGRHWRGLEPPRHLVLFNKVGLHRAVREAGFTEVKFRPRIDALPFTARQSRLIADGIDPYSSADCRSERPWPTLSERLRAISGPRSEFLTVTAVKRL